MKKADLRRRINSSRIGFDPDRMKTVHVANGLFTEILEKYYPTTLMNQIVVNERRNLPRDPRRRAAWQLHSNEELIKILKDREKIPEDTSPELLNRLRFHLHQHLDADNGVYDHDDNSGCAYSAATHLLVTSDRNYDGFSGNFLAYLLKHDFGQGNSPLVAKITSALNENLDPISILTYIFTPDEESPIPCTKTYDNKPKEYFDELIASNPNLQILRECLDKLSFYYPGQLSAQRFLRLLTILGSLVLIRYLVTSYNQEVQKNTNSQPIALLIDAQQGSSARIRQSSQASYLRTVGALNELYAFWLKDWILEQAQIEWNTLQPEAEQITQTYKRLIKESVEIFPRDTTPPESLEESRLTPIETALIAGAHMANNLLPRSDEFLRGFVRDLGIRCGLLKPRASSQKRKHIDPQADTLEVLVMTLLDVETEADGITLDDFANRLWKAFGMLFGGLDQGARDFQILANLGIQESNQDDLNENSDAFVARLVALGLAKEYADGLVLIQYPQ